MARQSIYITGAEHGSGKSAIALGMADLLVNRGDRLGFFRPVLNTTPTLDTLLGLVASRYRLPNSPDAMFGCTAEEAYALIADNRYQVLLARILEKYKALEAQCDRLLCVGTDFSGAAAAIEPGLNADLANNLGCAVMPIVRGHQRSATEIVDGVVAFQESLLARNCDVFATIVNRVLQGELLTTAAQIAQLPATRQPIYLVREEPSLSRPTVGDIARAVGADVLYGSSETLHREVLDYKVAAMMLPDFLNYVAKGSLIITPGDRADIILGSLISYSSKAFPQIAGILLTGGIPLPPVLRRLIEGLGAPPIALLSVSTDTFTAAMNVSHVSAALVPDDDRKVAAALGVFEEGIDAAQLLERMAVSRPKRMTPIMFEHELVQRAKRQRRHIVLPEGLEERILRAAEILMLRGVVDITVLGDADLVRSKILALGLHLDGIRIVDPLHSEWRSRFAQSYFELRKHKGISAQMAFDAMADVSYFGTMMVYHGLADGMVSGSVHTTQHTIRPAFEIIRTKPGASLISSVFLMCLDDRVLVYGDCAVNPNPDAQELAEIAIRSAETATVFGIEPRIALLSYATGDSGKGEDVERVRDATQRVKSQRPDLKVDGPIQYDAAVDAGVAKTKAAVSEVAGKATVFIFPDLDTGNNTYKAVQRSANAVAIGPILQGLNKPVNDLSRGCTVADIVNTVAITAIQSQTDSIRDE